jgi:hypothetical protein
VTRYFSITVLLHLMCIHPQTDAFKKPELALPVNSRLTGHRIKGSVNHYNRFFYRETQQTYPSIED